VIVFVADVEASLAFYEGVLGVERDHLDVDGSYGELGSGVGCAASEHVERHLDLPFRRNDPGQRAAGFELEFAVEDVDAVFARASRRAPSPSGTLGTSRGTAQRCSATPTASSSTSAAPSTNSLTRGQHSPRSPPGWGERFHPPPGVSVPRNRFRRCADSAPTSSLRTVTGGGRPGADPPGSRPRAEAASGRSLPPGRRRSARPRAACRASSSHARRAPPARA
jgi:Glyoxalase/Bleomycin resistance protein/Dioxygenase superfamily